MDHLIQDLRYALRSLVQRRGFSLVAVLTLGVGVGITTAIFSVVYGILLRPLPYPDSDRIVSVWQTDRKEPRSSGQVSHLNYLDLRSQATSLDAIALFSSGTAALTGEGTAYLVPRADATPGFLRVFGVQPLLGQEYTDDDDRPNGQKVVIVSYGFWREKFGSREDVIGTTLEISGSKFRIVAVAPKGFTYPDNAQLWTPPQNDDVGCGRGCVWLYGVGRLKANVSVAAAAEELRAIGARLEQVYPTHNSQVTFGIARLQDSIVGDVKRALYVLLGAVAMVLLIACANVANLLLVRGIGRSSEMAVRSALGAARRRLIAQLMTENLVLAFAACVVGVGFAAWGISVLRLIAPAGIPRADEVALNAPTLIFAFGLVAVTTLIFGLIPALQISRTSISDSIRRAGRSGDAGPRQLGRTSILVAEVALSIMLLLGAGLLLRSFSKLGQVNPGFDSQNVTTVAVGLPQASYSTPEASMQAFQALSDGMATITGVDAVALALGVPFGDASFHSSFTRQDRPVPKPADVPGASLKAIDPQYLSVLRIPLVRGRNFTPQDRHGAEGVALISRATAQRYFRGEDPIGKRIKVGVGLGYYSSKEPRTIIGVVEDVRTDALKEPPGPAIYEPVAQIGPNYLQFVIRSSITSDKLIPAVREQLRQFDDDVPLESPVALRELVDRQLAAPRFYLALISMFAMLAVLLAAVGIYGVVAFLVAHRTREIGVRMALGARAPEVIQLVVWQGLKPAITGVIVGLIGALAGSRVMRSLLFDVKPYDALTYASVTVLLLSVVFLACALPARRATRIPPAAALRSD